MAGTGQVGFNGLDLPALESWLSYPSALEPLPDGRLVVVDYNNFVIRALTPEGELETVAGDNTHGWAIEGDPLVSPMENPIDVSLAEDGSLWVAEQHTGRVLRIVDGALEVAAGTGEIGYAGDGGLAIEADFSYLCGLTAVGDEVLLADTDNHAIRVLDPEGEVRTLAGGGGPGYQDGLEALFNRPGRMHLDGDRLLIADMGNNALRALDLVTGEVTTLAGTGDPGYTGDGGPALEAHLQGPSGVVTDDEGNLYVADTLNNVVRVIDADGVIRTLAGDGEAGFSGDYGPAELGRMSWPADVAIGGDGQLYVADMRNSVVRRVTLVGPPAEE
ncbi:MAG: hypothetical protein H6741_26095 [Alphaproteobacteria bacterium]|nr:hypothetical protein [Alphaproteobacteria bacterium]